MKICKHPKKSPQKKVKIVNEKEYSCKFCKKVYQNKLSVYRHQKTCNPAILSAGKEVILKPIKVTEFICNICFKKFDLIGKLELHAKTHTEENNYCNVCGKRYKRIVAVST